MVCGVIRMVVLNGSSVLEKRLAVGGKGNAWQLKRGMGVMRY